MNEVSNLAPVKLRKYADRSGPRIVLNRTDGKTGKWLINPATGQHEPYPLTGFGFVDVDRKPVNPPDRFGIGATRLGDLVKCGFAEMHNARTKIAPAGRPDDPWSKPPHKWKDCDAVTFHTRRGSVRYNVVGHPGKYFTSDRSECTEAGECLDRYKTEQTPTGVYTTHRFILERADGVALKATKAGLLLLAGGAVAHSILSGHMEGLFGLPLLGMADFVYNQGLGNQHEYVDRINGNDPTNSALILVAINTSEADATLKDLDDLNAVLGNANTAEVTNTGYSRIVLDNTDSITATVDDANDRVDCDFPDQTFSSISAGDSWTDLLVCYDSDTTAGTDANIVPLDQFDFAVTPDGSDITVELNSQGFFTAS